MKFLKFLCLPILALAFLASVADATDLTITVASVKTSTGATVDKNYNAGATITAGCPVYLDSSNTWQLCIASSTAVKAAAKGISLNAALSGQPLAVQTGGVITIGATVTVGTFYGVSASSGLICPLADLMSTQYVTALGYADTAATLTLTIVNTGVKVP